MGQNANSLKARSMRSFPTRRTCRAALERILRPCWLPTSGSIPLMLKESFGQLWDYNRQAWARKFFENWRAQLKWQRLKPYERFAEMVEAHWDGIAAYCEPENKVPLGFVEGLNNKIRVFQR